MKKIPTLFLRDENDRAHVTSTPNPDCAWVFAGEGVATRKYDGTCVMLDEAGNWWARREVKPGKTKPANYWHIETDPNTGKTVGWEPIAQSPFAKFLAEPGDVLPARCVRIHGHDGAHRSSLTHYSGHISGAIMPTEWSEG